MSFTVSQLPSPSSEERFSVAPRSQDVPTNIIEHNVMSTTSVAAECFVNQRFSRKLQAFLISYNGSVFSGDPIYAV
jgi:hypothetical protein